MKAVLGLDTSAYTTSLALATEDKHIAQAKLLTVGQGKRGLQQSEAVFQHLNRLPEEFERLMKKADGLRITGVCASERPRDRDDSYMPVFCVGQRFGQAIAAALGVAYFATSHQQGHIRAAQIGSGLPEGEFLGVHLSGGTTEVFRCDEVLRVALLAGSADISAGMLIDRVGVELGLLFPAGAALTELAAKGDATNCIPTSIQGAQCHFSGAEAQAMRMIREQNARPEDVAAETLSVVTRTLAKLLARAAKETGLDRVLLAGGVAQSTALREGLPDRLKRLGVNPSLYWAQPGLSGDNAVGVARIGYEKLYGSVG
jgi:N6-L-threonylcarbamoyladenine synthase